MDTNTYLTAIVEGFVGLIRIWKEWRICSLKELLKHFKNTDTASEFVSEVRRVWMKGLGII